MFIFLCFLAFCYSANAQPGTLDKSYGNGGSFISGNLHYNIISSAIQEDGKVVVGGADQTDETYTSLYPYLLIRHNTDGSVDSSFGEKGKVSTPFNGYLLGDGWSSIKIQPDGKIIAAGYNFKPHHYDIGESANYEGDIVMARFNANGSYDASFGANGIVITDFGKNEEIHDMALQPDGKIVLAGTSDIANVYAPQIMIVRYNTDGTLDKEFSNGSGYVVYPGLSDEAYAVALQEDGKIIVGGDYSVYDKCILIRYLPNGDLDKSFGSNGSVLTQIGSTRNSEQRFNVITIDKEQRIIAGGLSNDDMMGLARYKPDGSLDNSFNTSGIKILNFANQLSGLNSILLQNDGKLVLAGGVGGSGLFTADAALARLLPDGSYDSSFGTNGQVITDLGNYEQTQHAVMQQDGKVVLTGNSSKGEYITYFLIRYNGDDNTKQPLAVRIKRWLLHHGISWQMQPNKEVRYYAVQRSADGIVYKEIAKLSNKAQIDKYEDIATITGSSYYRLAAIGWNGARTYSNTVLIDESTQVKVFPNPVRDNLQLQGLSAGKTSVSIVDLQGNVRSSSVAGGASYSVNTSQLTPGNYLLKLQHNSTTTTQPFVKE